MTHKPGRFLARRGWLRPLLGCVVLLGSGPFALAQDATSAPPATLTPGMALWSTSVPAPDPPASEHKKYSLGEIVTQSIFGQEDPDRPWTPLYATDFFKGWCEPWIAPPNGSSGAPRQGWLNSFDGHFTREFHLGYFWTNNTTSGADTHVGLYQFQTPLSRRVWLGIDVPFISVIEGANGTPHQADFGDIIVNPGVMLHETRDLSISARMPIRTPTGDDRSGGGQTSVLPNVQFWTDLGRAWTLRGGAGAEVRLDDAGAAPAAVAVPGAEILLGSANTPSDVVFVANVAIGRTITPHDATPFGDLAYYLAVNLRQDLGNTASDNQTFVSLTPAMRTHLGNNWFLLAGVEIPVTGPRPFEERALLLFVRGF